MDYICSVEISEKSLNPSKPRSVKSALGYVCTGHVDYMKSAIPVYQRTGAVVEIDSVWRGWPIMGRRGLKSRGRKAGEGKWEDGDG
jgi:hypothetical protein